MLRDLNVRVGARSVTTWWLAQSWLVQLFWLTSPGLCQVLSHSLSEACSFQLSLAWRFYFLYNLLPDYSVVSRMVSNRVCYVSDFKMHCWCCCTQIQQDIVFALFDTWQHCCLPVLLSKGESRGSGPARSGWSFRRGSALHRGMWLSCSFSSVGLGMWSLFNYWGCQLCWGTC